MSDKPPHIWQRFTQDSPEIYIYTTQRLAAAPDAVFESGAGEAATIFAETEPRRPWRGIAVDVDCSVGLSALPMASELNRLSVKIAPTMLDLLGENAQVSVPQSLTTTLADDKRDAVGCADLVRSRIV